MDLGCGSGDGYELLTATANRRLPPGRHDNRVLPDSSIEKYVGIDINNGLLEQGQAVFAKNNKVSFRRGNFDEGLPVEENELPFDIYLSTYGTYSHCQDSTAVKLLSGIARHANPGAVVVADWLAWHSFEWQDLWTPTLGADQTMAYLISYFTEPGDMARAQLEPFDLRLMNPETIQTIVAKSAKQSGKELKVMNIFDRSVFVGRHMETGDYNKSPQPIRATMNSLLEPNRRTDLAKALVNYHPRAGFNEVNDYFKYLTGYWNSLVQYVTMLLDEEKTIAPPKGPLALQMACGNLRSLILALRDLELDDARANIIEPQLAYHLRGLEAQLQQGKGRAHGIVAIIEVS